MDGVGAVWRPAARNRSARRVETAAAAQVADLQVHACATEGAEHSRRRLWPGAVSRRSPVTIAHFLQARALATVPIC